MKAIIVGKNKELSCGEIDKPKAGRGELLIKVRAAAMCGTDIRMIGENKVLKPDGRPLVLSHEISGEICEVGEGIFGYEAGQNVVIAPNFGCGSCDECLSGRSHMCRDYTAFGVHIDGGFAQYLLIPEKAVLQGCAVPYEALDPKVACLNEPLSCAFNGMEQCGIKPCDYVLIIGAGPIGMMHAKLALMAGAGKVIMYDLSRERLEMCRELDERIIITGDVLKEIGTITKGRGADDVIVACPSPKAQAQAVELAAIFGRVLFFGGIPAGSEPVGINTNLVHYKQLTVTGTTRASLAQFKKTLSMLELGLVDLSAFVTNTYDISEAEKAYENAKNGVGLKHVITFG